MICPDCGAEALPTYCQHLAHCQPYRERLLLGAALPKPKTKPVKLYHPDKRGNSGYKVCATPGCGRERPTSNAYCNACKARRAKLKRDKSHYQAKLGRPPKVPGAVFEFGAANGKQMRQAGK